MLVLFVYGWNLDSFIEICSNYSYENKVFYTKVPETFVENLSHLPPVSLQKSAAVTNGTFK